ncbi:MAG: peptidoglycan editing factor PgeF [Endozoicomonadaceae bacterium]|nr:peptidoglycan editing factor PgeF [Endozoicomonadaceae bacterium]
MRYLLPDWPAPDLVKAFVTTRNGGVSKEPWSSLNMSFRSGDDAEHVRRNRGLLLHDWQLESVQWLKQVHGTDVVRANTVCQEQEADACWTDTPRQACAVLTADCLPVIFCNHAGTRVAVAHAGWKGLADGVLEHTVAMFDDAPDALIAWLGPAISQHCFEVGPEVRQIFMAYADIAERAFVAGDGDRWFADIYRLARQRLSAAGVTSVYAGDRCTYGEEEQFFSYRRDGAESGRMASVIWIDSSDV